MARTRTAKPTPRKSPPRRPAVDDIPMLEWIAAGVGLVLAGTAIGLTAWDALFGVRGPPAIEVRLVRVTATPHGYVAEVEAYNHGGEPATSVRIEGVAGGGGAETSDFTLDYIPEQSHASGGLIFKKDPRVSGLKLRATGFADVS